MKIIGKAILISLLVANSINPISAQYISRYVFGAGGGMLIDDQISLSTTLGQHGFAGMLHSESIILIAGFEQPDAMVSTPIRTYDNEEIILIYPNPFTDYVTLTITTNDFSELSYKLYDPLGRILLQRDRQPFVRSYNETISTQDLPNSIYHLRLSLYGGKEKVRQYVLPIISIN